MHSPSFLESQRQLHHRQGHDHAPTLFGVEPIPCDKQSRTRLAPMAPRSFTPVFFAVFAHLEQQHWLAPCRGLDHPLFVSLEGTQSFSSTALPGHHCLTRQLSHGQTLDDHTVIPPVIACPGHAQVIALAPAYIMPQDGQEKQDCEQAAGTRGMTQQAATLVPHHVTVLGDELYSQEPFCAWALQQGCNCILVGKPESHPTFDARLALWQAQGTSAPCDQRGRQGRVTEVAMDRFLKDVLRQDGKHALAVHWVEMTVGHATTGAQLYYTTCITNHRLRAQNVAQVAHAGRGRGKSENENTNVLKPKGYHLEPNCGHGKPSLSAMMLSRNVLAFLCHTVLEWRDEKDALLRQVLARRQTFFEALRALTRSLVFASWPHLLDFMMKGLKLESRLESKLAFTLRPKLDTS